jgi:hypothetical protein
VLAQMLTGLALTPESLDRAVSSQEAGAYAAGPSTTNSGEAQNIGRRDFPTLRCKHRGKR